MSSRLATSLLGLAGAAFLLLLVNWGASAFLGPYGRRLLISWGINGILAVSLNIVNGQTGQFSLGHAGFMAVGAYVSALFSLSWHPGASHFIASALSTYLWPFLLLLAGAGAAAIAGALIAVPTFRLRGDYFAIATLGFGEVIFVTLLNLPRVGGARGLGGIPKLTSVLLTSAILLLSILVAKNLNSSRFGRAFASIRDDEVAAEAMGVNTTKYKTLAFAVAAFFAGAAGGLYALHEEFIVPLSFRFMKSVEIVIMCILGGNGSITGAVLGAGVLTILPEWLRLQDRLGLPVDPRMVLFSSLLIVLMLVRRQGLLGRRELSFSLFHSIWPKVRRG